MGPSALMPTTLSGLRSLVALEAAALVVLAVACGPAPTPTPIATATFTPTPTPPLTSGLTKIDLGGANIRVNSENDPTQGASALIDGNPATFWHVKMPREGAPAVWIDLLQDRTVGGLVVRPRMGFAEQLWTTPALLRASQDGAAWEVITFLQLDKGAAGEGAIFVFDNGQAFRHYQLLIESEDFFSMGEVEFYERSLPTITASPTPTTRPRDATPGVGGEVGERAPAFSLTLADNSTVTSASLLAQGKPLLLYFYTTW